MKTAEFGQPASHLPEPGKCRICGSTAWEDGGVVGSTSWSEAGGDQVIKWADETRTLCTEPSCIAEAKREIGR